MTRITKGEKRYILNADVARQVASEFFPDCRLSALNPEWRFGIPDFLIPFLGYRGHSFDIPDFVMGLLAEKLGLTWHWEKHPSECKSDYEKRQQWLEDQRKQYENR